MPLTAPQCIEMPDSAFLRAPDLRDWHISGACIYETLIVKPSAAVIWPIFVGAQSGGMSSLVIDG